MENPSSDDWAGDRGLKWRDACTSYEAMLAPIDAPLIGALGLDRPSVIADIGCGGGGTTVAIADAAPAGSRIDGFDISPDLIALARSRATGRQVRFICADAARHQPELPYDRLVSRLGVMFFPAPERAFLNLARWLRPGGGFAFAVWAPPADNPWLASIRDAAATVIDLPQPEPDAPGPFRYADAEAFLKLLARAGFGGLAVRDFRFDLAIGGGVPAGEAACFMITSSSVGAILDDAPHDVRGRVQAALAERFRDHEQGGVVRMAARLHVVTGERS